MKKERYEPILSDEEQDNFEFAEMVRELQEAKKQYEIAWERIAWERYYKAKKDLDLK